MFNHDEHVRSIAELMQRNFATVGFRMELRHMETLVKWAIRNYYPRTEWKEWDEPGDPVLYRSFPCRWYQVSIEIGGRRFGVKGSILEQHLPNDRLVDHYKSRLLDRLGANIARGLDGIRDA